jgi:hypothetical protein
MAPQVVEVDTGSLRGDLFQLGCTHGGFSDDRVLAVMASIITALQHDQEFSAAFRERFLAPKLRQVKAIYERARDRGEVSPEVDLDLLTHTLAAIILHRAFVLRLPVDDETVLRVIDQIVIPAATYRCPDGVAAHPRFSPTNPTQPSKDSDV